MSDDLPEVVQADEDAADSDNPIERVTAERSLIDRFFDSKTENTVRAYQRDLCDFAVFLGMIDEVPKKSHDSVGDVFEARRHVVGRVMAHLYDIDDGEAINDAVATYMDWLEADLGEQNPPKAPATINRRVAAIKSVASLGRSKGQIYWTIELDMKSVESYRDTSGPDWEEYKAMVKEVYPPKGKKEVRGYVMLRLAYVCALRRDEIVKIDCEDLDLKSQEVEVDRKGRDQLQEMDLPDGLCDWLAILVEQQDGEGPLFQSYDSIQGNEGNRLTGDGVYHIVTSISESAGVGKVHPHGIRHAAITHYLDRTDGDTRGAQALSGHKKAETLQVYDDNRMQQAKRARETLDQSFEKLED